MSTIVSVRRAPGPKGNLLSGSLLDFRRDPIELLRSAAADHGDIVRFRFGPVTAHLVNHPDHVEHALVTHRQHYDKHTRSVAKIRATCGHSLLTSDGDTWMRQRRIVQPLFQPAYLQNFVAAMKQVILQRMATWKEAARQSQPLELVSEMAHLTIRLAARTLFGVDVQRDADVIERALAVILDDTWRRLESVIDLAAVSPAFHRTRYRDAVRDIDKVVRRIIEHRRESSDCDDVVSALLRARDSESGSQLNDQEIRDTVMTLLLAGHETTANALAWTFALIAEHPTVMHQIQSELTEVLGSEDPDEVQLQRLVYTHRVFAETIRLYPSIWIMERRVVLDDEIDGVRIPAGSMLLISPYTLHRHPRFWGDPERFLPERFEPHQQARRPRCAFIPFGVGPHACIGQAMAQQIAILTLAMAFRRFRFTLVDPRRPQMKPGITLRHRDPLFVRIETRNDRQAARV